MKVFHHLKISIYLSALAGMVKYVDFYEYHSPGVKMSLSNVQI